jgi:uncharacterized protein (TIGR03437 family)
MLRKSWILAITGALMIGEAAVAGTFGKVVSIGGQTADLALDEARGVLYIANFTANRIDVMSLATNTVKTSFNVAAQPSGVALSKDGRWLVVVHYGNNTAPASPNNGITIIDLANNNTRQTFALGNPPLGVAFGFDNKALIVTTQEFILFDPILGTTTVLSTIQAVAKHALPAPAASFPGNIVGASVASSADYTIAYGLADNLTFVYDSLHHAVSAGNYTSSPPQGPRSVAVSGDGSYAAMGWIVSNAYSFDAAEFPAPSGILNVGGHAIDSAKGLVYSQVPSKQGDAPVMTIRDADNLTLRESIQLPENLAGKGVVTSNGNTIYFASDSGVLVLPVGNLNSTPRVRASTPDLVFRGNFCDRTIATQTITITDPGGGRTPFSISPSAAGVSVSPSVGVTPATVRVTVNPNTFQNQKGTAVVKLTISSSAAVNIPDSVRVLVNSREPDQRGTFIDIPGTLVDLQADPVRDRYYVLRLDQNQVQVFNSVNNTQIATLRTCTKPMSMAETFDGASLLVGCDNSHLMSIFDLESLQPMTPINAFSGYVQSLAVSSRSILAVMRDGGGGPPYMASVDLVTRVAPRMQSMGVFENKVALNTVLTSAPNGSTILGASSDGTVWIYDASVDSFTASRQDFKSLGGAYAASAFGQYVVGNNLLDSSGAPVLQFESATGGSSGFAFMDQTGLRTTAPDSASAGIVQRVDLNTGAGIRPTRMVEAPLLGAAQATPVAGGTPAPTPTPASTSTGNAFTRSLTLLPDRSALINLTTSGVTILPFTYDSAVALPQISAVVSAADAKSAAAPGGLISIFGTQLSPTNLATKEIPLPTALGNSCITINGQPLPIIFVSPSQINAQMPFQAIGNVTLIVHTPGGVSDNFNMTVQPNAPAVFLSGQAGPATNLPTVVKPNGLLVTDSNPLHRGETVVIYLTGLGQTSPVVSDGMPAPVDPLALALTPPTVDLGGVTLPVIYAGLAPGQVGVYQINATVPTNAPEGLGVLLTITQGGSTQTVNVRVVP